MSSSVDRQPLSPHISIYKPQITSILSITHRMTGVALYVGAFVLAWAIICSIYQSNILQNNIVQGCILTLLSSTAIGKIMLFGWTFCLYYHLLNGIRHLFWDMGKGFALCTATTTGWLVVCGAALLTAASWSVVLL